MCDLFNYYYTIPAIKNVGKSSYKDFVSDYSVLVAEVKDNEKTQADIDAFVLLVNQQLRGIDVRQVIQACNERRDVAHTDLRAKADQEKFLKECSTFDFRKHTPFARAVHAELLSVSLRRKN